MTRPFSDGDLDSAAALLAERHARHREAEPLLPAEVDFRAEVEALWQRPEASGAVSEHGFLIGAPREDPLWGPNVWVELAGHAVEDAEEARDLYALAAQRWVDQGLTRQYVHVPAHDRELVDAWFRLSFGQQHAAGIREVPQVEWPEGVREGTEDDLDALVALDPLLPDHQARSPVFGPGRGSETEEELRQELLEGLASPDSVDLLVDEGGRVVGGFYVTKVEESSLHAGLARPPDAAFLAWAGILPEARGRGRGLALTQAAFAWAHGRGHRTMVTDWRVTNLLSSRFWPARGFRTTFLRLYRSVP
jgi:ribosomal protein S18 acetylase RimI-like enzyme